MAPLIGLLHVIGEIHLPIDITSNVVFALLGGTLAAYLMPKVMARIGI